MTTATMTPSAAIVAALTLLAGLDADRCRERNDIGYNGRDSDFGNSLAEQAGAAYVAVRGGKLRLYGLTEGQLRAALKMLQTYKNTQLAPAGIALPNFDELAAELQTAGRSVAPAPQAPAGPVKASDLGHVIASGGIIAPAGQPTYDGLIDIRDKRTCSVTFNGYRGDLVALIREMPGRKYEGRPSFANTFPIDQLDRLIKALPGCELAPAVRGWLKGIEAEKEAERRRLAEEDRAADAALAGMLKRLGDLTKPGADGKTAMQHQRVGVLWCLKCTRGRLRGGIVADDMGLGKTKMALLTAKAYGLPVIVICPKSLMKNWLREAAGVQVGVEVYSWAKLPAPPKATRYILLADEAHFAQNMTSNRTKMFLALAEHAEAVFPLTGTPIKNGRPANLFPLLKAINHPLSDNQKRFERRYCNAKATRFNPWDTTGATYLQELHAEIKGSLLRRTKDECLDLPAKNRVLHAADISDTDLKRYRTVFEAKRAEYEAKLKAKEERAKELKRLIVEKQNELLNTDDEEAATAVELELEAMGKEQRKLENARNADAVVLLTHLRQAGAVAKMGNAIEMAEEVIEQGGAVVLFTSFTEVARGLAAALNCEYIDGSISDRQGPVDRFQAGERRAIVVTAAGGVGITLTAAATSILVDRPWTPGDAEQWEDRIYRIGQSKKVTCLWMQAGKVDTKIDKVLSGKAKNINTVLTGVASASTAKVQSIADIAADLVADIFNDLDEDY